MQVFYMAYCNDSLYIVILFLRSAAGLVNIMLVGRKPFREYFNNL